MQFIVSCTYICQGVTIEERCTCLVKQEEAKDHVKSGMFIIVVMHQLVKLFHIIKFLFGYFSLFLYI